MLTTTSILSRQQGRLTAKPMSEDEYYKHFAGPEPIQKVKELLAALRLLPQKAFLCYH